MRRVVVNSGSQDCPSRSDIEKIAVLVGAGGFAPTLCEMLDAAGVSYRRFTWTDKVGHQILPLQSPKETVRLLKQLGMKDLVHAGTFSHVRLLNSAVHAADVASTVVKLTPVTRSQILDTYGRIFGDQGIMVHSAADLFDYFRPITGVMGGPALSNARISELKGLIQRAKDEALSRAGFGAPQAVIFEENTIKAVETDGTDEMLSKLAAPTGDVVRTMIKFRPVTSVLNLDPPTMGPYTISLAREKGVRVVALDATNGVIVGRDQTANQATRLGVSLYGF